MDVGVWLRSLGLGQYEATFRDNEIDSAVLPKLTVDDLKDLGVAIVGHRRKIMSAIEELNADSVARTDAMKALPTQAALPVGASSSGAERRPITVMFCDLVGSTGIASKLDAEDWRNLVNAYLDQASAAVTDFGGHLLKKLGDGLMALFGYPQAQENDAERAVRAALAIQRALADLNARNARSGAPELSARIGIECGSVVVDASGEVFGEAPNVAARVQVAAEPGTVLVTASVQRQTAGLFVAEDKGAHELRGVAQPVTLYRIVRASGGGRRGGARALTPLVGREDELALLTRRWSRVLEGEGQFVQIVGEPGIGKSRLVEEFRGKLAQTPHTWVEWAASQLLQNTPLHPLAEWGRLRFGGAEATGEGRLADLENTLRLIGLDSAEYVPLLAPLVDIPLPEDRRAKFPPEEFRRRQLAAMTAWVLAGARTQPVVLAFEDLHWADPTSLDLLRALAERGAQSPLLVITTTRPEFRASWAMRSHHGVLSLSPLDRAQVRRMVGEIASRHALSDETIDGVGERTGGVPLFVEEVTRLLLERNAQGSAHAIPPTLQQSLAARLDRLGEAREVAQIGAVLGRDFSYRLLRDVSSSTAGFDEPRLQAALDRLTEADLLFVDGDPPTAAYRFKHALIQDAAYESLLKSRRQALHRRAAEALLAADAEPEPIAHHFTEGGLDALAIEWWSKAGERALRTSAYQEAIAHLEKALALAGALAESPTQRLLRLRLQIAYGQALIHARGFASQETTAAFSRAREFASGIEEVTERFPVYYGLWASSWVRGELAQMREPAQAFLDDTKATPGTREASIAHRLLGSTCWLQGDFVGARMHLENSLAIYNRERDRDFAFRFGQDSGVSAMIVLALTLWPLGEINRASQYAVEATTQAARSKHVATQAFAHGFKSLFEMMRRDAGCALREGEVLLGFAQEHVMPQWLAIGTFTLGWARWHSGDREAGEKEMRNGMALFREQGIRFPLPLCTVLLAEIEGEMGRIGPALTTLDDALADAERTGQHHFDVELHRQRGALLLRKTPNAAAEAAFMRAIEVAHSQQTRTFELRAAMSMARLLCDQGKPRQARGLLAPVYGWFTEGFDTRDLKEAKALLEALA
jgi:class 3 adenylate cyclase/predicted ATPase